MLLYTWERCEQKTQVQNALQISSPVILVHFFLAAFFLLAAALAGGKGLT
jgi:hypothetical protein